MFHLVALTTPILCASDVPAHHRNQIHNVVLDSKSSNEPSGLTHLALQSSFDPARSFSQFLLAPPLTRSSVNPKFAAGRTQLAHVDSEFVASQALRRLMMSVDSDEIAEPKKYIASAEAFSKSAGPSQVFSLLSSPESWSNIFLFTSKVEAEELVQDAILKELAGMPPILPLQLTWRCNEVDVDSGVLEFTSEGVAGIATDCVRRFVVRGDGDQGSKVELTTQCTVADSAFAALAASLLRLDNALFSLLLPAAIEGTSRKGILVWSVLILAWAVSSFGWLAVYT